MAEVTFAVHGARGSAPASGAQVERYGGHTTCYSIDAGTDEVVIVDAGSAIANSPRIASVRRYHLLFTHFHLDHVQGLPFFTPIYDADSEFVFYGVAPSGHSLEEAISGVFRPPWFPIALQETPSAKVFVPVNGSDLRIGDISIATTPLRHPQGCTAYRFDRGGSSVVIATDHEAGDDTVDGRLADLGDGADYLFHDGQYTPSEYAVKTGWGHSTWHGAALAADRAGVEHLVLTSHDPTHSDSAIDAMVDAAGEHFGSVRAAAPGFQVALD